MALTKTVAWLPFSKRLLCVPGTVLSARPHYLISSSHGPISLFPPIPQIRKLRHTECSVICLDCQVMLGSEKPRQFQSRTLFLVTTVPAPHRRMAAPHRELSLWNWHKLNSTSFWGVCRHQVSLRASPVGWAILAISLFVPQFPKLPNSSRDTMSHGAYHRATS